MKPHRKAVYGLTILAVVLALALLGTANELKQSREWIRQAQLDADTIYRGQKVLQDFCQEQIEEAKCKSL